MDPAVSGGIADVILGGIGGLFGKKKKKKKKAVAPPVAPALPVCRPGDPPGTPCRMEVSDSMRNLPPCKPGDAPGSCEVYAAGTAGALAALGVGDGNDSQRQAQYIPVPVGGGSSMESVTTALVGSLPMILLAVAAIVILPKVLGKGK